MRFTPVLLLRVVVVDELVPTERRVVALRVLMPVPVVPSLTPVLVVALRATREEVPVVRVFTPDVLPLTTRPPVRPLASRATVLVERVLRPKILRPAEPTPKSL